MALVVRPCVQKPNTNGLLSSDGRSVPIYTNLINTNGMVSSDGNAMPIYTNLILMVWCPLMERQGLFTQT